MVYEQLRRLKRRCMQREWSGPTPTALVNEAMAKLSAEPGLRMYRLSGTPDDDQQLFFSKVARQIRHILVEHAKNRQHERLPSSAPETNLESGALHTAETRFDVLLLDQLLQGLEELEPMTALTCELYYFGGHNHKELAAIARASEHTIQRHLRLARAWLLAQVQRTSSDL